MPSGERRGRGDGKKLTYALKLLGDEAYQQLRGGHAPFSVPWFPRVCRQWRDWQRGIPPSREYSGRAAQNPWLLECFAVLDAAEARSQETQRDEIERQRRAQQRQ